MLKSIKKEIETRRNYLNKSIIKTIYFGGGTPSILSRDEIKMLLDTVYNNFHIHDQVEITLECNPDDLSAKKLSDLKVIGINRLSIGIQSFKESDLKFMNRSHNVQQALESIELAKKYAFNNITIDLIYGLPNQSNQSWEENLNIMFELGIQHFSAYSLTVEPKTVLKHLIKTKKILATEEDVIEEHFNTLLYMADKNNFIHYEISNFSKKGFYSNHNSSYWKNELYLGIGPSAHSFNGLCRQWNISSNKEYIERLATDSCYYEIEELNNEQKYNEYILTNLRTIWGVKLSQIDILFGKKAKQYFIKQIKNWIDEKKILKKKDVFTLTNKGKLYADGITSDLFIV
tara:strand:- start:1234 stop:2268 length:1035 start_codon:yes stop_codon:yes gene_type:complete